MIENFLKYLINYDKNDNYIIFDIGSRDCEQSIEFYNTFPNAKIYAFECNPNTINICKKNIINYLDRITLIEGAVCDYDGYINFYPINQKKTITSWTDGNPGASSLFKSNGKYTSETYIQDEINTKCHRLDTIMNKYNINKVDFIWMDLQGAELLAIKSLGNYIKTVKYIHTEVTYREMYIGQVLFNEFNNYMKSINFSIINKLNMIGWQEDAIYINNNDNNIFDIVIPVGPNDIDIINTQIKYTKKNIIGYRNIYIISNTYINIDDCIYINENIFPFNIDTIISHHGKNERNGWYLQQLLKLYAAYIIPNISERYLVIDSDTFFLKPAIFIENNKCLYNFGFEYHKEYFEHMFKLNNNFKKKYNISGICHHMMFEKKFINEIFNIVEDNHKDLFYNVFLKNVISITGSGASEYELYFNYILNNHENEVSIRQLKWCNVINNQINNNIYDYISYHWHSRK